MLSKKLSESVLASDVQIGKAGWGERLTWRWSGDVNKLVHILDWPRAPWRRHRHFYWEKIRSRNFGVWREDFLSVNGFDKSFQGWGHEDPDIVLLLHNAGLNRKNCFCATEVYHLWPKENSRTNKNANRMTVTQRLYSGQIRATSGVDDARRSAKDVEVQRLN